MLPYLTIDIETGNANEQDIQAEIAAWKPAGNVRKSETIEAQRAESEEKIRAKSGLLDSAPVVSIACHSPLECQVFHTLNVGDGLSIKNLGLPSEKAMLLVFRQYLDTYCTPNTILVGHNCRSFDIPKLRFRFVVNGLRLPILLQPGGDTQIDDTMLLFARGFLVGDRQFVSLDEMGRKLGISTGKILNGADVPKMVERGEHKEIVLYNAADALLTTEAWLRLTSQKGD